MVNGEEDNALAGSPHLSLLVIFLIMTYSIFRKYLNKCMYSAN